MPLGFAKSVFTTKSAGPTRDGEMRAFTNDATQPGSSGFTLDKAATYTVSHSTSPFSGSKTFSMVFWFRLAQEAGNIDSPASRFIYLTDSDQSDLWGMVFGYSTNLSYMNVLRSDGNRLVKPYGSSYAANGDFMSAIADGAWHCIMVSMNDPFATATSSWFIDGSGTNEFQSSGPTLTTNINSGDFKYVMLRNNTGGHNTNYTASFESGPGFELGPIWLYDSYIDFTNATNRGYFYNASNVDGFVDGGTDGTAGGAPTPDVYMYHDASTLQVSSSQTPTVNTVTSNGGAIVVIPSSGGPGSGDTI
jgi:hypothetical protein